MGDTCQIKVKVQFEIGDKSKTSTQFVIDIDRQKWMQMGGLEERLYFIEHYLNDNIVTSCDYEMLKPSIFDKAVKRLNGVI